MTLKIKEYFRNTKTDSSINEESINTYEQKLGINLPSEYKEFLLFSNGIEGFVGESYLALFRLEDLLLVHQTTKKDAPNLLVIGTDGGGTDFVFDIEENFVVKEVQAISLGVDTPKLCANNFSSFLEYLFNKKYYSV